jgi:hypothetical protein
MRTLASQPQPACALLAYALSAMALTVVQLGCPASCQGPGWSLPKLPEHAHYVYNTATPTCEWATYKWALQASQELVTLASYSYFFFISCSARGPFLPSYTWV